MEASMNQLSLDLDEIQGDVVEGFPKNNQNFIFYQIATPATFKNQIKQHVIYRVTSARVAHNRELAI